MTPCQAARERPEHQQRKGPEFEIWAIWLYFGTVCLLSIGYWNLKKKDVQFLKCKGLRNSSLSIKDVCGVPFPHQLVEASMVWCLELKQWSVGKLWQNFSLSFKWQLQHWTAVQKSHNTKHRTRNKINDTMCLDDKMFVEKRQIVTIASSEHFDWMKSQRQTLSRIPLFNKQQTSASWLPGVILNVAGVVSSFSFRTFKTIFVLL